MVRGLDIFRSYFKDFPDQYVLIGGSACDMQFGELSRPFRATHDLDIVLSVEVLSAEFVRTFWRFVQEGGYAVSQRSDGTRQFYRFKNPQNVSFPVCIELFSRRPLVLHPVSGVHLTPVPVGDDVSSLSAILLDDDYANIIREEKQLIRGVPVVSVTGLVILKARAWMDLRDRRARGEKIDAKDIKKHRSDIINLSPYMARRVDVPAKIRDELVPFLAEFERELGGLQASGAKVEMNAVLFMRSAFGL